MQNALVAINVGPVGARPTMAAPAGHVVPGSAEVAIAGRKLVPVAARRVVTEDIGLAITVDVGVLGVRATVAAPATEVVPRATEVAIASREHVPVVATSVVAEQVGLAITADVSPLGLGTVMAAPATLVVTAAIEVALATPAEPVPVATRRIIAKNIGLAIAVDVGPVGPGTMMAAPAGHVVTATSEVPISVAELHPVAARCVVTENISLAVTVDVSPLGVRATVAAPAGQPVPGGTEVAIASRELVPVPPGRIVTEQIGLAVAVNVGPVGLRTTVAAPAGQVVLRAAEVAVAGGEPVPVPTGSIVA